MRVPKGREPYVQGAVPTWVSPIKDENGRWISSHVINQDIIAWVGQGRTADRTKENIGASDLGIAMIRKRLFDDLDAIAQGREPKAIIRSSNVARCVELPYFQKRESIEGITLEDFDRYPLLKARLRAFRHCYGQPPEVRRAFEEAMGIAHVAARAPVPSRRTAQSRVVALRMPSTGAGRGKKNQRGSCSSGTVPMVLRCKG